jgi:uncharacterized membrane protein
MLRLAYAVLLGVVGAGIVHIAVLLLLPTYTERDAWTRLAKAADLYAVVPADGTAGAQSVIEVPDPLFRAVACRFDLDDGPIRLKAQGSVPFWSASIYDRSGQNVYNFNDHTAAGAALDFIIVTPEQMIEMRKDLPPELESSIFVEADVGEGMVVIRSFMPEQSWNGIVSAYLKSISCTPQQQ